MKKFLSGIALFSVLFAFGCADPTASRSVNSAIPAEGTQIFRGADMDSVESVDKVGDENVVVMSGSPADFVVGGHIILDDSAATPGGRLYKIDAISDNGDGTVSLTCTDGLLADALSDASISYSGVLTNSDITSVEGRAIDAKAITFSDTFDIDLGNINLVSKIEEWAEADYGGSPIKASDVLKLEIGGKLKLQPNINIDLQIKDFKTEYAIFDVGASLDTTLIVDCGIDFKQTFNIPLFKLNYGVITIMAGPVPIIIQPQFDVILSVRTNVDASVKMVVSQRTVLRVCAEKIGDADWNTDKSEAKFSVPTFDGLYPKVKIDAGVTLTETAGLCLYGVLGLSVTLSEFANFSADIMDGSTSALGVDGELVAFEDLYTGSYEFTTGISAAVNIRISALGFINADFSVWGDTAVMAKWVMNPLTGYEIDPDTGMHGEWTFPAIQHLID